eukprot:s5626_g1.t1
MGSTEHGEMQMPAETTEAIETPEMPETPLPDVPSLPAMPVLTPLKPAIEAAAKAAEERDAEWPEPTSSKPDGGDQETDVRSPDGQVVQRAASPTRYVDEALRTNPSYLWCDDGCFRRLL